MAATVQLRYHHTSKYHVHLTCSVRIHPYYLVLIVSFILSFRLQCKLITTESTTSTPKMCKMMVVFFYFFFLFFFFYVERCLLQIGFHCSDRFLLSGHLSNSNSKLFLASKNVKAGAPPPPPPPHPPSLRLFSHFLSLLQPF